MELGGKNAIAIGDVAKHIGANVEFEGELDHQDIENSADALPEAKEVLKFMESLKKIICKLKTRRTTRSCLAACFCCLSESFNGRSVYIVFHLGSVGYLLQPG